MASRPQHRLVRTVEAICAALMTVAGHALVLVILAHRINSDRGTAEEGQGSALEVTFITLPRAAAPAALPVQPTVHRAPEAIEELDPPLHPARPEQGTGQADERRAQQQSQVKVGQGLSPQDSLRDQYQAAIRSAIERKWQSLSQSRLSKSCILHFKQTPGGSVTSASARNCDLTEDERAKLEAAVLMAQPLPYQGYESVFIEDFDIKF